MWNGAQLEALRDKLVQLFNPDEFEEVLEACDRPLGTLLPDRNLVRSAFPHKLLKALHEANRQGWLNELLAALEKKRPGHAFAPPPTSPPTPRPTPPPRPTVAPLSPEEFEVGIRPFRAALDGILGALERGGFVARLLISSHCTLQDVRELEIQREPCPDPAALYDHKNHLRRFCFSDRLIRAFLRFWEARGVSADDRALMAELFLTHEFLHLTQRVGSPEYQQMGPSSIDVFSQLDYTADASALEAAYRERQPTDALDATLLARLLVAQIGGGAAFGAIESADPAKPSSAIDGFRLRRQLIWILHHARARAFRTGATFAEFRLAQSVTLQLHPLGKTIGADLCDRELVRREDLQPPLAFHITTDRVIRHVFLIDRETSALAHAVFDLDLNAADEAFKVLFMENLDLTGKIAVSPGAPAATIPDRLDEARVSELLRQNEGPTLEFKLRYARPSGQGRAERIDEIAKDIVALANSAGRTATEEAHMIVGAGNDAHPDGTRPLESIQPGALTAGWFLETVNARCSPPVPEIRYEELMVNGALLGIVRILPSPYVHELTRDLRTPGGTWRQNSVLLRVGDQVTVANPDQIDRLRHAKRWGSRPS